METSSNDELGLQMMSSVITWGWYDGMFEDTKLVNWGTVDNILKIKTSQKSTE